MPNFAPEQRTIQLELPDQAATAALAQELAPRLRPGDWLALEGDLGAGKTTFTRALVNTMMPLDPASGSQAEEVPSPTFTLVQSYDRTPAPVWHFDLYRLEDPEEIFELGLEEALADGITVMEWPDRLGSWRARLLTGDGLILAFEFGLEDSARQVTITTMGRWVRLDLGCWAKLEI